MKTVLTLILLATIQLSARAADITGTWKADFDTQVGLQKYHFNFQVNDRKGTAETGDQKRDIEFKDAKLNGDTVTFVALHGPRERVFTSEVGEDPLQAPRLSACTHAQTSAKNGDQARPKKEPANEHRIGLRSPRAHQSLIALKAISRQH